MKLEACLKCYNEDTIKQNLTAKSGSISIATSSQGKLNTAYCKAPPLANTAASGSQQATQLSPRAAPPAECRNRKSISEVRLSNKRGAHQNVWTPGATPCTKYQIRSQSCTSLPRNVVNRVKSRCEVPNPFPILYFVSSKRGK